MKNFDDLFRSELANHAEVPPSRVWESLDKRLNTAAAGKTAYKGWYWYVGVASVTALLGGLAFTMSQNQNAAPVADVAGVHAAITGVTPVSAQAAGNTVEMTLAENAGRKPEGLRRGSPAGGSTRSETADNSSMKVTPFGNAVAVGTSAHSYDDFDERAAAAAAHKHGNGDDDHLAGTGYTVNKIRKNRMLAAEMVPVGGYKEPAPALAANDVPKPYAQNEKSVVAKNNNRRIGGAANGRTTLASTNSITKPVVYIDRASQQSLPKAPIADNASHELAAAPAADATPANAAPVPAAKAPDNANARPAQLPTPRPAAGGHTAARTKPGTAGFAASSKPSTGGSEPTKQDVHDTMVQEAAADAANVSGSALPKQKGLRGMFRRIMNNKK